MKVMDGIIQIKFENNILKVNFRDKFNTRRGRINCSIKDNEWMEMVWSSICSLKI